MASLIYTAITSLDGYVADESGRWDWSMPDAEVHQFVNDQERSVGTYLYGRRMYEVLAAWETMEDDEPVIADYAAIWRNADKVVYSRTLDSVSTARTRLEQVFDPDAVEAMKAAESRELSVGGPELAAQALAAGLVDEVRLIVSPVVVGGGKAALPSGLRVDLTLVDTRSFGNGAVYLGYRVESTVARRQV